jgi:hypothetical protein
MHYGLRVTGHLKAKHRDLVPILHTLKRVPIEENLDCLEVSSGNGGKRFATKWHLEEFSRA